MSRRQRFYLAQLRCGILPLHIETGRWYGVKEEDRLCKACNNNQIENEYHFIFHCNAYSTLRTTFYHASKPVWAGCVSSLYYIIQIYSCVVLFKMFTLLQIKYTYIHTL